MKDCISRDDSTFLPGNGNQFSAFVLETINDGIITTDFNWTILYSNKGSKRILRCADDHIIGKSLWQFLPDDPELKFFSALENAFATRQPTGFEEYCESLAIWMEVNAYPHCDLLVIHFRDTSSKKKETGIIKKAIDRYKLVRDFTSEAVWEWDLATSHIFWHGNKLAKILGYENPQRSMQFWESIVHPDDVEAVKRKFFDVLSSSDNYYTCQYRLKRKCGKYIYVKERASIIRNSNGQPVKIIGVTSDITTEKANEEVLVQTQENYRAIFEHGPLPQWVYDQKNLRFLNVNTAAIAHYGYTREEFLQMTLLDIHPKEECSKFLARINDNCTQFGVWTHQKKNGQKILVDVSVAQIYYQGNRVFLSTMQDITEVCRLRKQLMQEKIEKQKLVTKATIAAQEKERAEIGRELHDNINQVLAATSLYLEMIRDSETYRKDLIEEAKQQINEVINEIRFVSKSLATPVLLDLGFEESLGELTEPYVNAKKFQVQVHCSAQTNSLPPSLQLTLYRIIQEQLNNITKYAKASEVIIEVSTNKNVRLVIKDNGIGFDLSIKRKGVGITNIINRAEAHLGKVQIETSPGQGCQLKVEIPVR